MPISPNGFQAGVNRDPGVAIEGDFADANIRCNVLAGPGQLITAPPPRSPIVGHFAWANQLTGYCTGNYAGEAAAKIGFVHREMEVLIVPFLAGQSMSVVGGQPITIYEQGSFWANFPNGATVGQKVFANYADGSVYAGAAGAVTQVGTATASLANTGILTVTAATGTPLAAGSVIAGANVPAGGMTISNQLTGTIGGVGTYQTNTSGVTIASQAFTVGGSVETAFYCDSNVYTSAVFTGSIDATGLLTVTAVASGTIVVDQLLTGTGVPTGAKILALGTGTGGTGTYLTGLTNLGVVASTTITGSPAAQLGKISTWG